MRESYHYAAPCANCGEKDEFEAYKGGRLWDSSWGHDYGCCSDACGIRLGQKLNSGMVSPDSLPSSPVDDFRFAFSDAPESHQERRIRIKQLAKQNRKLKHENARLKKLLEERRKS